MMLMKLIAMIFVLAAARFIYLKLISPGSSPKSEKKLKDSKFDTDDAVDADYKEVQ